MQIRSQPVLPLTRWLLLGFVLLAFGIYTLGLRQNLPYDHEVDESTFVERAVYMVATGDMNPGWFGHPGSTVLYPLTGLFSFWHRFTTPNWDMPPDSGILDRFTQNITEFYYLGRLLSVVYLVWSVPLVYLIGRRMFTAGVGLAGAFLFFWSPLMLFQTHVVRTDSAALFFSLLGMWLCLRVYEAPTYRNYIFAGAAIGLAVASRYFMGALVFSLLLATGALMWRKGEGNGRILMPRLILSLTIALITFALTTPYFFLDFGTVVTNFIEEGRSTHLGADGLTPLGNLLWYLSNAIPTALKWPLTLFAVVGIGLSLWQRRLLSLLPLSFIVVLLLGISASSLHWGRWIVQTLPLLCLYAAAALLAITRQLPPSWRPALMTSGIALLAILPAYPTMTMALQSANPSTNVVARTWVLDNIPPNSKIAQEWYGALLNGTPYALFVPPEISLPADRTLAQYYEDGFRYFIISSRVYGRYQNEPTRYTSELNFYQSLAEHGTLLQQFEPSTIRGGPVIKIYALASPPPTP